MSIQRFSYLSKVDLFLSKIISQVLLTDVKGKVFIVQMLMVEIVTYCLQVLEASVQSLAEARKSNADFQYRKGL